MFISATINELTREIKWDKSQVAAVDGDYAVNGFKLTCLGLDPDYNLTTGAWYAVFTAQDGTSHSNPLTVSGGVVTWEFDNNINKGGAGVIKFFLYAVTANTTGKIIKRWDSAITDLRVAGTIDYENQEEEAARESEIDRLAGLVTTLTATAATINDVKTVISRITNSSPVVVTTVADLSGLDTTKYQLAIVRADSYLYLYDGAAWQQGIKYGSYELDTTLTESGKAADAAAVGAEVSAIKGDLSQVENYIVNGEMLVAQTGDIREPLYIQSGTGMIGNPTAAIHAYVSYVYEIEPNAKYIITTNGNRLIYGLYESIAQNAATQHYVNANDSIEGEHEITNGTSTYLVVYCGYDFDGTPVTTVKKVIEKPDDVKRKTHFNILIFGNSYAADAWGYVPFILKKYGITVNIYMYYRGSGSPSRLVQEWEETTDNGYDIYGGAHIRRMTHIDTRTMSKWTKSAKGYSAKMLLELANDPANDIDKWDIITLQLVSSEQYQVDGQWTMAPGIEPALRQIINLINASYDNTYTLGFLETYNRIVTIGRVPISVLDNRIATMQANEAAYKAEPFDLMIPVGAAVFSGRTNTLLSSTDVSDMGNLWSTDLTHLQEGVPCYLAACTVCQAIFNKYFPEYSVLGDDTRITSEILTSWNVQFRNGTPKEANELAYQLAQKCAVVANERPFDISPIYTPDDTAEIVYDRSKYWADSMIDTSSITG